ncbi:hypothetical protein [Clostridium estertheticum]|uniref:Uncharacterized protein n=1 Tax=Clostridium estertheticum TaxID=238834 RepID=A0A7Y3SZ05_9CLOT|nr:hypothetical protein [Clostridium estertheticum]MBW9172970.1 hypothetical protein [Clostridium estertheticum]NNU77979.1 hypothetical protein [Clostridium estertheticum]WBL47561.1 hypothetical protein LOR37_02220 [Clostridium estertheticum]WLC75720.1 hypothetical protein KTC99_02175 [Clostridium estertheticum]WLC87720.1 hypothetical protein KTC95_16670 [Clostridium estertheticum]
MRVFQLKKDNEYYVDQDTFNMKIERINKINCITIDNPVQNNCLCVINHLVCRFEENKNTAHLIITNDDKQLKDTTTFGGVNIGYKYDKGEPLDNLEIDIVNIDINREIDMLEKYSLIILPGGNIQIKLEEPQEKMSLRISVGKENI